MATAKPQPGHQAARKPPGRNGYRYREQFGQPVAHLGVATRAGLLEARACRLVVMPEWQGAGVGLRFLNACCERWLTGQNRYGIRVPTLFHTSHPGLAAALRRHPAWTQVSAGLVGGNKARSLESVQGFRYLG